MKKNKIKRIILDYKGSKLVINKSVYDSLKLKSTKIESEKQFFEILAANASQNIALSKNELNSNMN